MVATPGAATPRFRPALLSLLLIVAVATAGHAEPRDELRDDFGDRPDGIHVLDGSYVLTLSLIHI